MRIVLSWECIICPASAVFLHAFCGSQRQELFFEKEKGIFVVTQMKGIRHRTQIGMFRPIRMDHTNCLQVAIKSIQFNYGFLNSKTGCTPNSYEMLCTCVRV
jgi:hypothetical protein